MDGNIVSLKLNGIIEEQDELIFDQLQNNDDSKSKNKSRKASAHRKKKNGKNSKSVSRKIRSKDKFDPADESKNNKNSSDFEQ